VLVSVCEGVLTIARVWVFGNMCTLFSVNYIVCTVFSAVHLCVFIVIYYVCTNIRTAATELKLDCTK
jgi:uncharacterized membrane protein